MIRTFLVVLYLAVIVLVGAPFLILHALITKSADFLYRTGRAGLRGGLRIAGVRIRMAGVENIPLCACIFVANHASNLDPPVVMASLSRRVGVLAKKELFRIPLFGTFIRFGGIVPVDRSSAESAAASAMLVIRNLKAGISYLVFPEGTRSADGRVKPFKKGSFLIAIQAGVPVVPVSIAGTQKLMGKGARLLRSGEVTLHFGPAVETLQYGAKRRAELMDKVHGLVAEGLPEEQKPG